MKPFVLFSLVFILVSSAAECQSDGHKLIRNRTLQAMMNQQLIEAVKRNNLALIKTLLKRGASANAHDNPAHRRPESKLYTDEKASKRRPGKNPPSALHVALGWWSYTDPKAHDQHTYSLPVIHALLDAGANVNEGEGDVGETPLMMAVNTDNLEIVRLLIRRGAKVNAVGKRGGTALVLALLAPHDKDRSGIVKLLLDSGADATARDPDGNSLLVEVRGTGRLKCTHLLVDHGADVNAVNKKGRTVLAQMKADKSSFFPPDDDVLEELRKLGAHE